MAEDDPAAPEHEADALEKKITGAAHDLRDAGLILRATSADVAVATAAAVGTVVLGPTAALAAVGGIVAGGVAKLGIETLRNLASRHAQRRSDQFLSELNEMIDVGSVPAEGDPDRKAFEELLFHSYRHLMSALDDAVIPALARLTSEYRHKRADPFFRGVAQTLEAMDAKRLDAMDSLLATIESNVPNLGARTRDDEMLCFDALNEQRDRSVLRIGWGSRFQNDSFAVMITRDQVQLWTEVCLRLSNAQVIRESPSATIGSSCFYEAPTVLARLGRIVRG